MRRKVEKNATTLERRFRNLAGLKLLLSDELRALDLAKRKAISMLDDISEACTHRPQTIVEQVALSFSPSAIFITQRVGRLLFCVCCSPASSHYISTSVSL